MSHALGCSLYVSDALFDSAQRRVLTSGLSEAQMTPAQYLSRLRLCLAILPVLLLLAATWAQASAAVAGPMQVEICSDGVMKTVWMDSQGEPATVPHDCSDCSACTLPVSLGFAPEIALVVAWVGCRACHSSAAAQVVPPRRTGGSLSLGPPALTIRLQS